MVVNYYILTIVIILILILIICEYKENINYEKFDPMRPVMHVKLNDWNAIEYISDIPPCGRGEFSCAPITCPAVFKEDNVCWKCWDAIYEPQND